LVKIQIKDYSLYIDGFLKKNLDFVKKLPEYNFDAVALCTGYEGSGKSTFFMQIAYYLDPNFSLKNIVFNAEQFNEATENLPKGSVILYDEADDVAVGGNHAQNKVKQVISKMKRIRSRNLYILFVTPTYFDLGKYFAIHRSRFLIHVYSQGLNRGFFAFYGKSAMKNLYFKGKKMWDMKSERPTFRGRFLNNREGFPINFDEYEVKKDKATSEVMDQVSGENQLNSVQTKALDRRIAIFHLNKYVQEKFEKKFTKTILAKAFGISVRAVHDDYKDVYGNATGLSTPELIYDPYKKGNRKAEVEEGGQ